MLSSLILSAIILSGISDAAPAIKNDGYIHVPVKREISDGSSSLISSLLNNASLANISLVDNHISYKAFCAVGNPPQSQELIVDTGSAEIWVYGSDLQDQFSSFDPSKSSSAEYIDHDLILSYGDGSNFTGYHYSDDFSFSGVTVVDQEFGYINSTDAKNGTAIWGLAPFLTKSHPKYPAFNSNLKSQGFVKKEAFSMSLNDIQGQDGSIVFGALDKSKYVGDLWAQNITLPDRFSLNLTSLTTVNGTEVPLSAPQYAILDSGTTSLVFPDDTLAQLVSGLDVTPLPFLNLYFWNSVPTSGEVELAFGDAKIKIAVTSLYNEVQNIFGIPLFLGLPSSFFNLGDLTILGDPFLRSAYVVYDYDDWEIAIAQASDGSGEEDIVIFEDTPGIPGALYL